MSVTAAAAPAIAVNVRQSMKLRINWLTWVIAACFAILFSGCATPIKPDYPASWPKLMPISFGEQLVGTYGNKSDDYTRDNRGDYRPDFANVLGLDNDLGLGDADRFTIKSANGAVLEIGFYDLAGKKLGSIVLSLDHGWHLVDGHYEMRDRQRVAQGGDSPARGTLITESHIYLAADGSLAVKTRFKFSGIQFYLLPGSTEVFQWTIFKRISRK